MKFLEAVKILYPEVTIRTNGFITNTLYNEEDMKSFLGSDFVEKVPRIDSHITAIYQNNTAVCHLTEQGLRYLLDYSGGKIKRIKEMMKNPVENINLTVSNDYCNVGFKAVESVILTSNLFKILLENSFPDELFVQGLECSSKIGDYKSSMYLPKYNISFEFPETKNSHIVRSLFCEKTNTKCIQLHDESTFNGDLAKTMQDFSVAIGVANAIITTHNKNTKCIC